MVAWNGKIHKTKSSFVFTKLCINHRKVLGFFHGDPELFGWPLRLHSPEITVYSSQRRWQRCFCFRGEGGAFRKVLLRSVAGSCHRRALKFHSATRCLVSEGEVHAFALLEAEASLLEKKAAGQGEEVEKERALTHTGS